MAKVIQLTNDGTRTETTILYQASSLRAVLDRFDKMKEADKQNHADTFEVINAESYSYQSGVTKFHIKVVMK